MDNWSDEPAVTLFEWFSNLPHHPLKADQLESTWGMCVCDMPVF